MLRRELRTRLGNWPFCYPAKNFFNVGQDANALPSHSPQAQHPPGRRSEALWQTSVSSFERNRNPQKACS